eukprot:71838-Prorocentrum_lima.AAC.1
MAISLFDPYHGITWTKYAANGIRSLVTWKTSFARRQSVGRCTSADAAGSSSHDADDFVAGRPGRVAAGDD